MKKYHIEFEIKPPNGVTEKQVSDWARYMIGDTGRLANDNPLLDEPFDPIHGTFKIEEITE